MTETKKRIEEYNKKLPRLKERVIAAVALLIVSASMLATASFAWVTLSVNPEVSNITTAIAANGNLEIALATGSRYNPKEPGATQIDDGNIENQDKWNITWGNLVNLSDPIYGLSNIVLRPAYLNESSLDESPLKGALYDADGRHKEEYITTFRFAQWRPSVQEGLLGEFELSNSLGVRAITSTKIGESSKYAQDLQVLLESAENANTKAQNAYLDITNNKDIANNGGDKKFMEALAFVMGTYMTSNLNSGQGDENLTNPEIKGTDKTHLENFRDLFAAFQVALEYEREAFVALANLQLYIMHKGDKNLYNEYANVAALLADKNNLASKGIVITGLAQNLADTTKIDTNYEKLVDICKLGSIRWVDQGINSIVNQLVNIGNCTLDGTKVSAIGAKNALGYLNKSCTAVITDSIIKNYENRTGARMRVGENYVTNGKKGIPVSATAKRYGFQQSGTIYAIVITDATESQFTDDLATAMEKNTGGTVSLRPNETYGFAIDFWVRTNALDSYLTLEGNVLTKKEEVEVKGKDYYSNEVDIYTITIKVEEEGESIDVTYDIYKGVKWYAADTHQEISREVISEYTPVRKDSATGKDAAGNDVDLYTITVTSGEGDQATTETHDVYKVDAWFYADSHQEVEEDVISGKNPTRKIDIVETVIGYEGENRVWGNNALLSTDSTTQGSGSCYVYYANSPEDKARSLKLLGAMRVAFVDADGELMAEALMDTAHHFDDNGKIIVPLVLSSTSINLGEDLDGKTTYAITGLEQNVAKLITAIVYLDGTTLTNSDVLANSDIEGQFNIQFGSSVELNPAEDEELELQEIRVSASIDKTEFDFDTATEPMTSKVTVTIEGTTPTTVRAFFIRAISDTQGIPLNGANEIMTFTNSSGSQWTTNYTFTSPGKYILRGIEIDGVEYDLNVRPQVVVKGFTVSNIWWDYTGNEADIMTAASSRSVDIKLQFASDDPSKLPSTVQGRFFEKEDGTSVNINFTKKEGNVWEGTATFAQSGTYDLKFLLINGNYTPVAENQMKTVTVYLGMKVEVLTDSPQNFCYGVGVDGDESNGMLDNEINLYMTMRILDNTGEQMENLRNVKLYYYMEGYTVEEKGMHCSMTWNQLDECYQGSFPSKVGIYKFLRATVGENNEEITNATTSPVFVIIDDIPPSFNLGTTVAYQYCPDPSTTPARLAVKLYHAEAITKIIGIVKNTDDPTSDEEQVVGTLLSGDYVFNVPIKDNAQDGTWTLTELWCYGVVNEDGEISDEDNPYVIDLTGKEGLTAKVVSTVNVTFNNTETTIALSGGVFMETKSVAAGTLDLKITDKTGGMLDNVTISDVALTYTYKYQEGNNNLMLEYGGYTTTNTAGITTVYTIGMTSEDGINFTNSEAFDLTYAGKYVLSKVEFKITPDGETVAKPVSFESSTLPEAPMITLRSEKPTVKVTGISPEIGTSQTIYNTKIPSTTGQTISGTNLFKYSAYNAVVYLYNTNSNGLTIGIPQVTLTISNISDGYSNAQMIFETSNSDSVDSTFSFGSGRTATANIGKATNGSSGWSGTTYPLLYPAGTMTQNVLTLDYGDYSFSITLDEAITINQPVSPAIIEYTGVPDSYTTSTGNAKPTNQIGTGTSITVTLPKLEWTETIEEAADANATWSAYTSVGAVDEGRVYGYKEYKTGRLITTQHKDYQYYEWTKFQSTYTGITNVYNQSKVIDTWIINGKEYEAGTELTFDGEGLITAIAVVENTGERQFVKTKEETSYKYLYGYVKGEEVNDFELFGNFSHTPSGIKVGNTVTNQNGAYPSVDIADPNSADANNNTIGTNMTDNATDYKKFWP